MPTLTHVHTDHGVYQTATFPAHGFNTVINPGGPAGGIQVGDECLMTVAHFVSPSSVAVYGPLGWSQKGSTPNEVGIGSNGSSTKVEQIWYHRADGGSNDLPSIRVQNFENVVADVKIHWLFTVYRGAKLSFVSKGSVGNDGIGPPSLPATVEAPTNSLIFTAAYQTRTITAPVMVESNGFTLVHSAATTSTISPLGLGASHLLGASGTIDLPQWLVSRGNNPAQHHVAWTMFKVDEIKPFIRLDGLTFGHKRRRLGQPTPGATP